MAKLDDLTSKARNMSPNSNSWRGDASEETYSRNKSNIDRILDYKLNEERRVIREVEKESFRSDERIYKDKVKYLNQYLKESLDATNRLNAAWNKTPLGGFIDNMKKFSELTRKLRNGEVSEEIVDKTLDVADNIADAVGNAVKKAVDYVVKRYADYARYYESTLKTVTSNLNISSRDYSGRLQGVNRNLFSQGLGTSISMNEVMQSYAALSSMGLAGSNLGRLSTVKAASSYILPNWNPSMAAEQMRIYGGGSGIFEMGLASEAVIRDALQEQFGDSQYISSGMFDTTKQMAKAMINTSSSAEASIKLQAAMAEGIGTLVEQGLSSTSLATINADLQAISEGDYSRISTAGWMAIQRAGGIGQYMDEITDDEMRRLAAGYSRVINDYQTSNRAQAGAFGRTTGLGAQDLMNGANFSYDESSGTIVDADSLNSYLDEEMQSIKDQQTFQQNVEKGLTNIIGLLGGNKLSLLGSGYISAGGGLLAAGAGIGASSLVSGLLGKSLGATGGASLLGKLFGGAASGGAAAVYPDLFGGTGISLGVGVKGFLGSNLGRGLGVAGGVLGMGVDAYKAVQGGTYSDNAFGNILGGAFLGSGQGVGGVLGNVGKGAAIGTAFGGPAGTVIGGIAGLALGLIGNAIANKREEEVQEASQILSSSGSKDSTSSIVKTMTDQSSRIIYVLNEIYSLLKSGQLKEVKASDYIR